MEEAGRRIRLVCGWVVAAEWRRLVEDKVSCWVGGSSRVKSVREWDEISFNIDRLLSFICK